MESTATITAREKFIMLVEQHDGTLHHKGAREILAGMELPNTRMEDWRYTRTGKIASEDWKLAISKNTPKLDAFRIPDLNAYTIVLVDGIYRSDLSDTSNVVGVNIATDQGCSEHTEAYQHFFQALAASLVTSSLRIDIAKNAVVERPLHIIHVNTIDHVISQPEIEIQAGISSKVHIIESFVCSSEHHAFTNRTLRVLVGQNAEVCIDKIQQESDAHHLMNEDRIHVEGDGRFTINTLTVDGGWVRNNLHISFGGPQAEANLHGIYLPRKKQHIDNHTLVDHRVPHCNSNELYKGLLNDQSIGVFNGKVYVQPDAQKTNAFQSNANILLSDDAQMNTKPELEIYADDVKCSHGTTTGQLDEDALFYLKARGLGDDSARRLLTSAFISDVLNKVENESVRQYVVEQLVKKELLIA